MSLVLRYRPIRSMLVILALFWNMAHTHTHTHTEREREKERERERDGGREES